MSNPYAPSTFAPTEQQSVTVGGKRNAGTFLFRDIEFEGPFSGRLVYSGWWWVQRIKINGHSLWRQISWKSIQPRIEFQIPEFVWGGTREGKPLNPKHDHGGPFQTRDSKGVIESLDESPSRPAIGQIEIDFTRTLFIRRFRFWIDDELVYDEIN